MKPIVTIAKRPVTTLYRAETAEDSRTVQGDGPESNPDVYDTAFPSKSKAHGLIPASRRNQKETLRPLHGDSSVDKAVAPSTVDPRLEKITKQLLSVRKAAKSQPNSSTGGESDVVNRTLSALWPQRALPQIHNGALNYREPTSQLPLMGRAEFVASLKAKGVPLEIIQSIELVTVDYHGFDGVDRKGQLAVHSDVAVSTSAVFARIFEETDFPITSMAPVSEFGWSDKTSVKYNNSSGFNWRLVSGSEEVSDHSFGGAIDINPRQNPWVTDGGDLRGYDPNDPGTLSASSDVVRIFKEEGWQWGGDWKNSKDWQHFYRPEVPLEHFGKAEVPE